MSIFAKHLARGFAAAVLAAGAAAAATPTVEDALKFAPVQKDVSIDQPQDAATCTMKAEKIDGQSGWVVRDKSGKILRRFVDTNSDGVVDQWSFYRDNEEVYRDIDSNHNGKVDQYRWLMFGGSRWGIDKNEDNRIDSWKMISAEEASAEVIRAMANRDAERFSRLLLTQEELQSLGAGETRQKELTEKLKKAAADFSEIANRQQTVKPNSEFVDFAASPPGLSPAGADGATKDVLFYENSVAMFDTAGKSGQVQLGMMIRVGDVWRLVSAPSEKLDEVGRNVFARSEKAQEANAAEGPDAKLQPLLAKLEQLEEAAEKTTGAELARNIAEKADTLEAIAEAMPNERASWIHTMVDTISAAAQTQTYPDGVARLETLQKKLEGNPADKELAAFVKYKLITVQYVLSTQDPNADFAKIQDEWIKTLGDFVAQFPTSPEAADAMVQLGASEELAGREAPAKEWYLKVASNFPDSPLAKKATGAARRLSSVGQPMQLRGIDLKTGKGVDISQFKGRFVLVQYWATWSEPCKADFAAIRNLVAKYPKEIMVIGVPLDDDKNSIVQFLNTAKPTWPQLFEQGGMDSRLAQEMGIHSAPTMMLIDETGKVVNRDVQMGALDTELQGLIRR